MIKPKSPALDAVLWVVLMALAAAAAFGLLQRDKQRHFGAVSFGVFPEFRLKTAQGADFDYHQIKSRVWAVHAASSAVNAMSMARRLTAIEQLAASGKRHLYILTFSNTSSPILKPLMPFHHIIMGDQKEISSIFSFSEKFNENNVLLVDQNGIIRGQYDFDGVDDYRRFQQDLLRLL
ncbi:MAG: hypothetical protein HY591_05655 [Candidatus Omnitrophica bacterium]|nr:hypothetical protein [Candidatus Omnitrophota bacterium]